MFFSKKADDGPATPCEKFRYFFSCHWRGVQVILTPLIAAIILISSMPVKGWQWCAYTLAVMASYWVTECIPLPVTSFLPIVIFPITGIMDCIETCKCYLNDTILVFIGSLMLAAAVEQSGLHIRLALCAIRTVGCSHYKLLFAMCMVTMFWSMWITNTAATIMVVPIIFALLKVFQDQRQLQIYVKTNDTEVAGHFTVLYFCAATFSATIGGIGTLIGTGTNLVFKGIMDTTCPSREFITFPNFSMFSIPYMLVMELAMYLSLILTHLGCLRPKSALAKKAKLSKKGIEAANIEVLRQSKEMGKITFWECMVLTLFGLAIALFFSRSPKMFSGWGDVVTKYFGVPSNHIKDSANTLAVILLMLLIPSTCGFFTNCSAKYREDLPKGPVPSVIRFVKMDASIPYSFMFLLGAGFALAKCAGSQHTDLNGKIGDLLAHLKVLPLAVIVLIMIIATVFLTNFASNVAVANVVVPIGITLAKKLDTNPLLFVLACGVAASYCFMIPVGTPGNLIVQSAAKVSTGQMMCIGALPTVLIIIITWVAVLVWAPVIYSDYFAKYTSLNC